MAGAYSYALLVELGENNTAKLKNKLVKYFQSKKSGGGECEVEYENGSRTATLSYCSLNVKNVLARGAHQISLDKGVLKVTVRLLKDESKTSFSDVETPFSNMKSVHNTMFSGLWALF
uniref:PAR14-like first RRM domain-containing protein n=1 Tax=Mola mola TaxID=94237 RepID=A0A3Q4AQP9_MOLML